jgi:hypothetical protein
MSSLTFVFFQSSKLLSQTSQFSLIRIKRYTTKHCTENFPDFYIHVSVRYLYIPTTDPQMQCSKIGGLIVGIYKFRNWERGHAVSFLGILVSNFRYNVRYPFNQSEVSLLPSRERLSLCTKPTHLILLISARYSCPELLGKFHMKHNSK